MMPRLAALSIAEIMAWTFFASGFASVPERPFCILRRRVRTLRLRRERTLVWRARLEADFVLAIGRNCERGGSWQGRTVSRRDRGPRRPAGRASYPGRSEETR